jgi:DNA primase
MDAVEEIKSRLAIEDVVSEYVQLKRSGRNFKGLSPFTSEKTASFMVSPEKQIWHDFSSGKGGDMFSFVMEVEGLDFKEALELLARRAGIDLEQFRTGPSSDFGKVKERLYQANDLAAKFYQAQFAQHKGALSYIFEKRQFTKDVVLAFRIGYSPNTGTALLDFLKKKGFNEQELIKAGLITKRYRGAADMFRGRIQIPLADPQGRIVGFTARLLQEDPNAPKYLNTPQTPLYDKGRHVYGLHLAKEAIRRGNFVVLAEGNLDVIASHQAGIQQVVATAGTALTEMQLKTLRRFTPDVRLAFDQDQAGLTAAERAISLAGKTGISLSMITIPSGKDPDELIKQDPDAWTKIIQQPIYAIDWLIERYAAQLDLSSALGKRQFSDIILKTIRQLPDQVEQDHYVQVIAQKLSVSKDAITRKLQTTASTASRLRKSKITTVRPDSVEVEQRKTQDHFLALMFFQPSLRHYLASITPEMFREKPALELRKFLETHPKAAGELGALGDLESLANYGKILSLQYEALYQGLELLELRNEATRLQARLIEQYVKTEKQPLIEAMRTATGAEATKLLEKAKQLDSLLQRR